MSASALITISKVGGGFDRLNDPAFIWNLVFVLDMTTPNLVTNLSEDGTDRNDWG